MSPQQRKIWLDEAIALLPVVLTPGVDYRQEARELLYPLIKKCKSNSKKAFWQFLRLQLLKLKTEDAVFYLENMQEHKVPPETDAPFLHEVNCDIALIDLGGICVWKIPATDLVWVKAIFPVYVRELPPLEAPEFIELRSLKARLRSHRLSFKERLAVKRLYAEKEAQIAAGDIRKMPKRHGIFKKVDREEVSVARLYLRADVGTEVDALDGDLMNFGFVPASTIARPIYHDGVAIIPGIANPRSPIRVTPNGLVPNLYVVQECSVNPRHLLTVPCEEPDKNPETPQQEFEKNVEPHTVRLDGDVLTNAATDHDGEQVWIDTGARNPVNADLGTHVGVNGKVEDAGSFKLLSVPEANRLGLVGWETQIQHQIDENNVDAS